MSEPIMMPNRTVLVDEQKELKDVTKIRVLVIDDHPITRFGIAAIIEATPDMTVVAQAGSGEEAVELYEKHLPDITLMDLRLPGMSGVEAIRAVMARHRQARFVVLTTYEGDEDIHQALQAGARSYIVKGMPHEALVNALRRVHSGGQFLPPPVSRALFSRIPNSDLSAREREVLGLIVRGRSNKEIATELGITESTVKCHVSVILMRLNVSDRTQAVVTALRRGLVHL
ncbi:MAG: response regulator transcription factor [Terracidiphilus sp.]|nr:response regulator transcription factor [Terracidiphilus sp.]